MAHQQNKRNNANTSNISVSDLGTSGFDLSYKTKDALRIGRRELIGYHKVLAGDTLRISTQHMLQFMPTTANMLPAMDVRLEHTFIPFRNINSDYEDSLSYDKGQPWTSTLYPTLTLADLASVLDKLTLADNWGQLKGKSETVLVNAFIYQLRNVYPWDNYYLRDYIEVLVSNIRTIFSGWASMTEDAKFTAYITYLYDTCIRDFCGYGSYLDKLDAPIVSRQQFVTSAKQEKSDAFVGRNLVSSMLRLNDLPISEMVLRTLYADWFENVRDSNLEPARSLPRYHKWTNAVNPVLDICFFMLAPRYATLGKDIFTTAQIDSPYRHIVAPIIDSTAEVELTDNFDISADEGSSYATQVLSRNPIQGTTSVFPIPNPFGVAQNSLDTQTASAFALDLEALKKAKQAKAWLMRGHVYGDEYQDYLLAQYGVRLSDARINKPLYLGGNSQEVNIDTQTANVGTENTARGSKNCTMTCDSASKSFDFFSEENGIVLVWAYIMPAVSYNPYETLHMVKRGVDFPQPVFANDSEELSIVAELDRTRGLSTGLSPFGRHPYAHAWRSRVDENHGIFLDEMKPVTFMRDFQIDDALGQLPKLNYSFIHPHVNLGFMVDTNPLHTLAFGTFVHNCYVTRKLPIVTDAC